jgi:hypothetical protein
MDVSRHGTMNPFTNPHKRDVSLPAGCKDLIDVLHAQREVVCHGYKSGVTDAGFVITVWLPDLHSEDVEITAEGDTIRITGKQADCLAPFESVVHVPSGHNISAARAVYLNNELRIVIPKSAA